MLSALQKSAEFFFILIACCIINTLIFFKAIPVFYLPDFALLIYLVYKFRDLNQEVSSAFWIGLALLLGYFFLSPEPPQTQFANNYILVLKVDQV